MTADKEIQFFKLVAVGAILLYLYKVTQKSGGALSGNPYGVKINADKIAGLASQFVPREYRNQARQFGSAFLTRMIK